MCDTMVRLGDDGVLFAKNSDRDPNECQVVEWHAATRAGDADGGRVRCTWIDIPAAPRTHAVVLSRPWWMWGAEIGANEHGVVIGNEAVFTDEPYADEGLLGMDLLRLALERGATATEAVEVIVTLLERHGQGGSCSHATPSFTYHNSFLVADPSTAFVVETAGRKWATEEVAPGSARSISNGLTIPGFAGEHADRLRGRVAACAVRRSITERSVADATDPLDLMAALRSHGHSVVPTYSPIHGGLQAPCVHGGGIVTSSQTTASWVADLRRGEHQHWVTATAAPCTSVFKPVRVDEPIDLGPTGDDQFDESVLWWRHERLHRAVARDPGRLLPRFRAERDALEAAWVDDPPAGGAAFALAELAEERWLADVTAARRPASGTGPIRALSARADVGAIRDRRPPYVRRRWARLDRAAGMPRAEMP